MTYIYVFKIVGIIIIYKEKTLEGWSTFIVWKINRGFHLIIFHDLETFYLYYLVLAFYIDLVDNVSVISY